MATKPLILLVDDSDELRETLGMILEARGFDVVHARNGRDALDQVRRTARTPSAIVLDLDMPIMDGPEFLARKPSEPLIAGTPVVISTAEPPESVTWPTCVRAVLVKPTPLVSLLAALKSACSWARMPMPRSQLASGTGVLPDLGKR